MTDQLTALQQALYTISEALAPKLVISASHAVRESLRPGFPNGMNEAHEPFVLAGAQQSLMEAYCLACAESIRALPDGEQEAAIVEKGMLFAAGLRVFSKTGSDGAPLQ